MITSQIRITRLDEAQVAKVRTLEDELGRWVVVVEPVEPIAELSGQQLQRLQALEQELGVILLAYIPTR